MLAQTSPTYSPCSGPERLLRAALSIVLWVAIAGDSGGGVDSGLRFVHGRLVMLLRSWWRGVPTPAAWRPSRGLPALRRTAFFAADNDSVGAAIVLHSISVFP